MSSNIRIVRYRDNHIGGKFDGNCYVNTLWSNAKTPKRVQLKVRPFPVGEQFVWGSGSGNNEFSLKVVNDGSDYFFRVRYLDYDYNFRDYLLNSILGEKIYVGVYFDDSYIYLAYRDGKYGNYTYYQIVVNNSNETSYSVSTNPILLGTCFDFIQSATNSLPEGNFDTPADWTYGTDWDLSSGMAVHSNTGNSDLFISGKLTPGKLYKITYALQVNTAGNLTIQTGTDTDEISPDLAQIGTTESGSFYLRAGSEDIAIVPSTDFEGTLKYVEFYEITEGETDRNFTGEIFHFDNYVAAPYNWTNYRRITFYDRFADGNTISPISRYGNDLSGLYNKCQVINQPVDFWDIEKDVSDYLSEGDVDEIEYKQDEYRTPELSSWKFKLFNYFEVYPDDTIGVYINDKLTFLFNVEKTNIVDNGYYLEVECEDIFKELENINSYIIFFPPYDNWQLSPQSDDRLWTSLYQGVNNTGEQISTSDGIGLLYILKMGVYLLNYDNILTLDLSISNQSSIYYDYVEHHYMNYNNLFFDFYTMFYIGRYNSMEIESTVDFKTVFRDILRTFRLTYYIQNSVLYYKRITYGSDTYDTIWSAEPNSILETKNYHSVAAKIATSWGATYNNSNNISDWGDLIPDMTSYHNQSWEQNDIIEAKYSKKGRISEKKESTNFKEISFDPHFWIFYIADFVTGGLDTFRDTLDSQTWIVQLAHFLDIEFRRKLTMERIIVPISDVITPNIWELKIDIEEREMEVYQVASGEHIPLPLQEEEGE